MRFHFRGFVSLSLALAFLAMSLSGVMLYIAPRGRVANWTGWTVLGLDKQTWQAIHINIALLFLVGALLHLGFNWKVFWCYIKKRAAMAPNLKAEMLSAVIIVAGVLAGTVFLAPPFGMLQDYNYRIKDYWDRWAATAPASAPIPHAEELTLGQLATHLRLPLAEVTDCLEKEGIQIDDRGSLAQLAQQNGRTPRELLAVIHKHFPEADRSGQGFGPGQGKRSGKGASGKARGRGRSAD